MAKSQGAWWIEKNYPPAMLGEPGIMTTEQQYNIYFNDLVSCVFQVFKFSGLPETVDSTYFRMCLFLGGRVALFRDTKGDNAIRALDCATAGKPDIYYMPEKVIIVNPTFKGYSYNLTPGKDVGIVFCREVDRYQYGRETGGLFGLIATTAQLLADNTISINTATKNMRLVNLITADNTNTKKSVDLAISKMYNGAPFVAVMKTMIESLQSVPLTDKTDTAQLIQLLQTRQYIYAHFYECIGLKTHDQMKKERLITSEIDEGAELAVFNVQDMIFEIGRGLQEVNRIFDLNIEMQLHPLIMAGLEEPEELADDQSDGSGDGEPEEMADNQSDGSGEQNIQVNISGSVSGEVNIDIAANQSDGEPEGGEENADLP